MADAAGWRWEDERRPICDLGVVRQQYAAVHEFVVSPDGEAIAAPVTTEPDTFRVWTSGLASEVHA
jgi:hypothetical protein